MILYYMNMNAGVTRVYCRKCRRLYMPYMMLQAIEKNGGSLFGKVDGVSEEARWMWAADGGNHILCRLRLRKYIFINVSHTLAITLLLLYPFLSISSFSLGRCNNIFCNLLFLGRGGGRGRPTHSICFHAFSLKKDIIFLPSL